MTEYSDGFWIGVICGVGGMLAYGYFTKPAVPTVPAPLYTPWPETVVGETADGSVWRVIAPKVRGPREARMVWVTQDHSRNKKAEARSSMALYRMDCGTSAYQPLHQIDYDKDGNSLKSWDLVKLGVEPSYAAPETLMDKMLEIACNSAFDPPKEKSQTVK